MPEAAKAHTDVGAVAFAKYYIDVLNALGRAPQKGVLDPLALPSCKSCDVLEKAINFLVDDESHYSTNVFTYKGGSAMNAGDHPIVLLPVIQNAKVFVEKSGATRPGQPRAEALLRMSTRWEQGQWFISLIQT